MVPLSIKVASFAQRLLERPGLPRLYHHLGRMISPPRLCVSAGKISNWYPTDVS